MTQQIAFWALTFSQICFVLYVIDTLVVYVMSFSSKKKLADKAGDSDTLGATPNIEILTKLLPELTKLISALSKSGPGFIALMASIVFIAISAWASSG